MANTDSSQIAVKARAAPRIFLTVIIQVPGFGMRDARLGKVAMVRKGSAMPTPSAKKTANISAIPPAKAKPTAVPKKGAEQGVANSVANAPVAKLPLKL